MPLRLHIVVTAAALMLSADPSLVFAQEVVWEETADLDIIFSGAVSALFAHPDGDLFVGTSDGLGCGDYCGSVGRVFRSTDFGQSWDSTGYEGENVNDFAALPNGDLLAATLGGIFISSDRGEAWAEFPTPDSLRWPHSVIAESDSVIYVGLGPVAGVWSGGLYGTSNRGQTWIDQLGRGIWGSEPIWDLIGAATGSFLAASHEGVWATNGNIPWSKIGLDGLWIRELVRVPGGPIYARSFDSVFETTDGGHVWARSDLPVSQVGGLAANDHGDAFVSLESGLYGSHAGGPWQRLGDGVGIIVTTQDDHVVAASFRGKLFRTSTRVVLSGHEDEVAVANNLTLHQNFPNPFSNSTTISFELATPGTLELSVFDVSGRLVAKLLNATVSSGTHSVDWDARDLPPGSYLLRIDAGQTVASRRATVVR